MPSYPLLQQSVGSADVCDNTNVKSSLVSRNITVSGRRTSVRLEPQMWQGLNDICLRERATLHDVCTYVANHKKKATSLTAAIRVYIMEYFRAATTEEGHIRARHGQGLLGSLGAMARNTVTPLAIVAGVSQSAKEAESSLEFCAAHAANISASIRG